MKSYAEELKKGTTDLVIRLRFIFLISLTILVALYAASSYLVQTAGLSPTAILVIQIILGGICALTGPIIALKDPTMSMKMFGAFFSIFYISAIAERLFS